MIYYPPKAVLESGCRFLRENYIFWNIWRNKYEPRNILHYLALSFVPPPIKGWKGRSDFLSLLNFYQKFHLSGKKRSVLQGTLMGVPRQLPMLRAQFESLELKEKVKMVERRLMSKKAKVR